MTDTLPPALRALVDKRFDFGGRAVADHDPVTIVATLRATSRALLGRDIVHPATIDLIDYWADTIKREIS